MLLSPVPPFQSLTGFMRAQNLQRGFFLGLLLLVTVAFLWLIGPFFKPIFWAVVLYAGSRGQEPGSPPES